MSVSAPISDGADPLTVARKNGNSPDVWKRAHLGVPGTGTVFPRNCHNNSDLAHGLAVDPNWIREKRGVRGRFVSPHDETAITLRAAAAFEAIQACGHVPDLLGCCTCTPSCAGLLVKWHGR